MKHSQKFEEDSSFWQEPWVWIIGFVVICILVPTLRPILLFLGIIGAIGLIGMIPIILSEWKEKDREHPVQ